MKSDYCPVANEPCQAMCLDGCRLQRYARDTALLRQALEALEYAADHTEPAGPDCKCPICGAIEALEDRLGATK